MPRYTKVHHEIVASPNPASAVITNSSKYRFEIKPQELPYINKLWLRFEVTEGSSSDMVLTDVAHWIDRLILEESGSGERYENVGDALYWEMCNIVEEKLQTDKYKDDINVSPTFYETGNTHGSDEVRYYRLPLISIPWIDFMAKSLSKDWTLEIRFKNGVASGSGTISLTTLALECDGVQWAPSAERALIQASKGARPQVKYFLQPQHVQSVSATCTAGSTTKFSLDSLRGECAFMIFMLRNDSYGVSGDKKFLHMGYGATVDIENQSGASLWARGTPVQADKLLQNAYTESSLNHRFPSARAVYLIDFCHNIPSAFHGDANVGGFVFDGSNHQLALKFGSAGTACVQTIDSNSATPNDGGGYKYADSKGHQTAALAFNANAAAQKAALEALPSFKDYPYGPLTVTSSGAATGDHTLTFNTNVIPPNEHKDRIELVAGSLTDGGVPDYASTTTTTRGKVGWTTSSTVTLDIYAYMKRKFMVHNGRTKSEDI